MATNTLHYNLIKPDLDDPADIEVINNNMDKIDSELWSEKEKLRIHDAKYMNYINYINFNLVINKLVNSNIKHVYTDEINSTDDVNLISGLYSNGKVFI